MRTQTIQINLPNDVSIETRDGKTYATFDLHVAEWSGMPKAWHELTCKALADQGITAAETEEAVGLLFDNLERIPLNRWMNTNAQLIHS